MAAETHVDRSIDGPKDFINSNIYGVFNLLEAIREYNKKIKLIHVSTDEVYGDLKGSGRSSEKSPYKPSSPYSASKASSDHLIQSYVRTFGINASISNCCNNYGPGQFPEKLIPTLIFNILNNRPLPIYGKGINSREWIYVEDHCRGLLAILKKGKKGESYNIGTRFNINNLFNTLYLAELNTNKLDANNPNNLHVFEKKYSQKNTYDNFNILNNRIPKKQFYAVVVPDYVTITYDFNVTHL